MRRTIANIFWLGTKELRSLRSDKVLVFFMFYAFTASIFTQARGTSTEVNHASIAFVDEDRSALSRSLISAFFPPRFQVPVEIRADQIDEMMDTGHFMFVVVVPPRYELNLRSGRRAELQVNVDATAVMQASIGAGYITNIVTDQVTRYLRRTDAKVDPIPPIVIRKAFNPNGDPAWFSSIVAIINQITMLTTILTGAALIREREHGTLEHLMVMPLTPMEIALAKVWANGLVILSVVTFSMIVVVRGILSVPITGSPWLFIMGVVLYLYFASALGIFLGTIARTMAQFALLIMLVLLVLNLLSGGQTPVESQPMWMRRITLFLPSRHFVALSQAIIYRGAGLRVVWPQFLAIAGIGLAFFAFSLRRFRQSIAASR